MWYTYLVLQVPKAAGNLEFNNNDTGTNFLMADDGDFHIVDGDLVFSTAGHGIDFSATSDASGGTGELFDDYEEGSFTPTITNCNNPGVTNSRVNRYRKIGNMLFFTFDFFRSANNMEININGNSVISGLPFSTLSAFNSTMNVATYYSDGSGQQMANYIDTSPAITLHGNGEKYNLRHLWGFGCYPTS